MESDFKAERPPHPKVNANIFQILTFGWTWEIFKLGRKRDLTENDLYTTLNEHSSAALGNELKEKWKIALAEAKISNSQPSLIRTLFKIFGAKFMLNGFLLFIIEVVLRMIQPMAIGYLIGHFDSPPSTDLNTAIIAVVALLLSTFTCTVGLHQYMISQSEIGFKMRVAVSNMIYSKALRLSKTALGKATVGQVVNLLSNDVNRFDTAIVGLHYLWVGPLETIIVTYFLWNEVGVSSMYGVTILLMFVPLQCWMGKKISDLRLKAATKSDERVRLMNEIISGIKVIKMYTWEKPFAYVIKCARKIEIKQIKNTSLIRGVLLSFVVFHTRIALFVCILSYVLIGPMGKDIMARKVFVVTSYYNILRTTMTIFFPMGIAQLAELKVSIVRLQDFLSYEEKNDQVANRLKATNSTNSAGKIVINNAPATNEVDKSKNLGIVISNATAKWTDTQTEHTLSNINLIGRPGRLIAVIGPIGAGKSSLLQAILRELPLSRGTISVHGVVAYASQEPWLFAGSVKQNIIFGSPLDKMRYRQVVEVCELLTDFKHFPFGDSTTVGERGITLSGGQKARINLARAIYKQADIYLLDDPLSAVDTSVGKHLFEKCIKGFLKDKTCILITHQLQYLPTVDQIVLMKNASILAEGTYQELQASNLEFAKFLDASVEPTVVIENGDEKSKNADTDNLDPHNISLRRDSIQSVSLSFDDESKRDKPREVTETQLSGNVPFAVYSSYFSAGGNICKILFLIFMCISTQLLASGGDYWITFWVNLEEHYLQSSNLTTFNNGTLPGDAVQLLYWLISRETCIIVFVILTISMILVTLIRSITFVLVCMRTSIYMHNKMFNSITRATMYFFNSNSSGRVLNRFSKDMGSIDELLPMVFMDCLQHGFTLVGIIVIVVYVNVYLLIPTAIIGFIFYKFRMFYLSTSRSVKRLEGITRSPVFSHMNASLQGLTTIRAFEAEQILTEEFNNHQDLHSSAFYLFISASRAFGFCLDVVCLIYISIVIFSFLVINKYIYGGVVGLVITQVIGLADTFQWGMRQSAELENQMTSVERVLEYTNISQESALESPPDKKPPTEWPQKGEITFKNFSLRYSPNLPKVIKNININIEPREKIGIVGRTGAGKSSLIGALFRLAFNEGSIIIDNIDINILGLHDLRSKISIIPQEPVLFSGTLRTNLDPFNEYLDHSLWDALDQVELKSTVANLPDGLHSKMSEDGSNFSIGQKQLVCLARAIVRNNRILLLDEATANVDPQTDALIQNTIRKNFRKCTVLTIAHRLKTVMDSDKVLVMDAGIMVEFDHPFNLLKKKNGFLYNMVEKTGKATADALHNVAAKTYECRQSTRL